MTTNDVMTVWAARRRYRLDDATMQRLHRLLRGREVPASTPRRVLYTRADVEHALKFDTAARKHFKPSDDLHYCGCCHKAFISAETLQRHLERDHGASA